eukprot:TRINITY_DN20454_c0_g1_i1.p1 TRINITY_DN20454_c0_g1~~TRINITY_DN20454_c0_g1_i1.p1  ORF type:complete len:650 (+),score=117.82 TRINITY_DN20454_c0_g1_i1:1-1950(+)
MRASPARGGGGSSASASASATSLTPAAALAAAGFLSVRERQKQLLSRMLPLAGEASASAASAHTSSSHGSASATATMRWCVLIYDDFCRDIISPLFKVADLRKLGITVHMSIASERQPIADTPAIYFVLPTEANVDRIAADCAQRLYDSAHLHFARPLPRPLLDRLAEKLVQTNSSQLIASVFDEYCDFVALEASLFSLQLPQTYTMLNDTTHKDSEIEAHVDTIVNGLFSALATLGTVPILRSARGDVAEMVARQLDAKLRAHLNDPSNLFAEHQTAAPAGRVMLVIVDRNVDLCVPLHHTWLYQPLCHDLLDLSLNRVDVAPPDAPTAKKKTYDLDSARDKFWAEHSGSPFPTVGEEVHRQTESYKTQLERLTLLQQEKQPNTQGLASIVGDLPELQEQKRMLDVHTLIGTHILDQVKTRRLGDFYSIEEALMGRQSIDGAQLAALLSDQGPSGEDKVRLALINLLCTGELPTDQAALALLSPAASAVAFVQTYLKNKARKQQTHLHSQGAPSKSAQIFSSFGLNKTTLSDMLSSLKLVQVEDSDLPLTKVVDALFEGKAHPEADHYIYLDPKLANGESARVRSSAREAIVFVVGGGNYTEYQNLLHYAAKQATPRNVIYGCTDLVAPTEFLNQLAKLGAPRTSGPA